MSNANRITMISSPNTCTKCNGSGKVGYRRANGVCFRCNGLGFISKAIVEPSLNIPAVRLRPASFYAAAEPAAPAPEPDDNWLMNLFCGK